MNAPAKGLSLVSIVALIRKEIERSGTKGPKGEDGKQGATGERGAKGDTGPTGKQGPKGKDGKQGKSGKDGSDGKDGDDGVGIKDINQDIDGVVIVTMTDGETYEIEIPLGLNTEVHYKTSGGGSGGTVDLAPYVLRPTTRMSGWLAYREDGNKGEWTPVTTDLVTVNPNQFRDINGRFAPTPKELEGIDNQRDVNEFLYGKIQEVGGEHEDFATQESLAKEAEMRREKDEFLQDQINNNQSTIDTIQEKGYDDTELRQEIADEVAAREKAVEAEKWERSLADIGLRDSLQSEIDILKQYSFSELDDKINIESETRRVADQGLQAEINSLAITLAEESNQRESADTELQGQIDSLEAYDDTEIKEGLAAEITAREEGDASLQGQIDAISEKGYDDTEIREGLAAEIDTRESEDKALQKQIEAEKQERSLADIGLRDSLQANIDAIEVPSIEGLATEEYVDSAIEGIEFPETDLTGLATEEYVDAAVSSEANARREADIGIQSEVEDLAETVANLEIPSIDGLASEEWVTDQIDALEPYDDTGIKQGLSDEAAAREERDNDLQDQIDQISSSGYDDTEIREGLAKELEDRADADSALAKKIEDEKTERSLADIGLRDSLQANIDAIEIPSLDGYATEEYVDGAIDAIPETDLSEYAKTEYVDSGDRNLQDQIDAISEKGYDDTEIREGLAAEAEARESADKDLDDKIERERIDRSMADIGLRDSLKAEIDAIEIPSLDGYATEEWVEGQIDAIEFPETDLSEYAKTEYVDAGDANLQTQIDNIEIPSIDGLATEEWVTGEIEAIEFPETDLTDYYTKGEVDESQQAQDLLITENKTAIGDEAQARSEADAALDAKIDAIEIPSLEGYATEGWVTDQIDAIPETDLSNYYTKTEVDESQSTQDDRITVNEGGIASNAQSIKVEAGVREQEDNHLQAEIDQIALALETLLVQQEAGRWKYIGFSGDNIPRNPGEFSLLSDDLSSAENNITINQTDLGDKFHGFAATTVGDFVEIVDLEKPDEYALFIVDSEPNGTGIVSMNLKLKDKGNNFLVGTTCEIRFFQLNEQDLDLTELDARYLKKKGGRTDGILILGYDEEVTNNEAAAQIGFVKTHVDEAIQRIPPPDLSAYALTEYVDEADLNLQQQIDAIEIPSLEGYATEEYVDSAVDGIEFPETDLSDYYTKEEVDASQLSQDEKITVNEGGIAKNKGDIAYLQTGIDANTAGVAKNKGDIAYLQTNIDTNTAGVEKNRADILILDGDIKDNTAAIESEAQARADADANLQSQIDAIEIPSIDGLATEDYVDSAIDAIEFPETDLSGLVSKTGGDDMEGPLRVNAQEASDGRATSYVQALGIYSKSDGSALRLGTTRDRVYIGHNDTTFNGPVKLEKIQSKKEGEGVPLSSEGTASDHLITKGYVDEADANLQSQIDAIDIPDSPDLSDYVSKTAGDQTMTGPLTISGLGTWQGSRVNLDYLTAKGENDTVKIGTPDHQQNLKVYSDKVKVTDVPISLRTIIGFADGMGTHYEGAYSEPNHIATKKDVDAVSGGGDIDTSGLVKKSGDTMTGTLVAPRFEARKGSGEAVCLIQGKIDGTGSSARLTFSNSINSNAYGNFEWHGNNGSGWFQFNKDIDLSTKGLHSVNNIRLIGNKAIQEAQTTRIKFDGKVIITRTGDSKDGFAIKGRTAEGNNGDLLSAYHNSSGFDAINYRGKQGSPDNLATCGYVDSKVGGSGSLLNHMERLYKKGNGTDGKTFYFQNQYGSPTSAMNDFRKFKWKLPASHYLMPMVGAGRNMGYVVITSMSGQLQYQCQVSNSEKSGNYITLELDHENHYGSNMMGDDGWYIVQLFSFLREA